jgi:hypothetical protein
MALRSAAVGRGIGGDLNQGEVGQISSTDGLVDASPPRFDRERDVIDPQEEGVDADQLSRVPPATSGTSFQR